MGRFYGDLIADARISEMMEQVFQDEPIRPRQEEPREKLPALLRAARSLETAGAGFYQNRRSTFLKQARLLADYEDDYPLILKVSRYYTTYEVLTDRELRSYFSWRTKVRRGDIQESCASFAFLYLYELINQIGVENPLDGLEKMDAFAEGYGKLDDTLGSYCPAWRRAYIIYYDLPNTLLKDREEKDRSVPCGVLDSAPEQTAQAIVEAVKGISPGWLRRSKYYRNHTQDMDTVIAGVLRQMCLHYRKKGGRTLCDQLFGRETSRPFQPFYSAVFCDPLKRRDFRYTLSPGHDILCQDGYWMEVGRFPSPRGERKLDELMKCIDASMRAALGPGAPIQRPVQLKWVEKIIQEEIQALLETKNQAQPAAQRIAIDYSALDAIRRDAAITQEKLAIEEELEPEPEPTPAPEPEPEPGDCPLDKTEYRLLQCLLYGGDTRWVQQEGKMLSVLLDSINEKLYDAFQDSVIEDGTPVEDYADELKEMVKP